MQTSDVVPADKPEVTLKRVLKAPRALVYQVWTQPEYVQQWWGVDGSTIILCEMDLRPGGTFRIDMKSDGGTVYVNRGVYVDVVANTRIVYKDVRDESAHSIPAGTHTISFEDVEGGTVVTLTSQFETLEARDTIVGFGVVDGIRQSLERLARLVASLQNTNSLKGNS